MDRSRNQAGPPSVLACKVGEDLVEVQYKNRSVYLYKESPSAQQTFHAIETLARSDRKLNS